MVRMLKKAIQMGHAAGHRVTHFETAGVVVKSFVVPEGERVSISAMSGEL
jgi:hypothetical protein